MEQTKEKKYIVGSILCGLLTAFGIVASVMSLFGGKRTLSDCGHIALLLLIAYYAFLGYKKPHGNLLKYIMMGRVVLSLINIPTLVQANNTEHVVLIAIGIGLGCYIAGRLAKVKENLILMIVVSACIVIGVISDIFSGIGTFGGFSPLIVWLDICVAYFLRYKQHREAGLEDAPKSK